MPTDPSGNTIWGTPGETWVNNTGDIYYQLKVNWKNTCGRCAQYDGAVRQGSWALPFHRHCNCSQTPILPGQAAPNPFTDFKATIESLDPEQQKKVVGASNWKLIESGEVAWEDVVTPFRVRDLSEVVALNKLSLDDLEAAGIKPSVAEAAYQKVHTPEHDLIEARRKELLADLKGAGLSEKDIAEFAAEGIVGRIVMGSGAGAPSPTSPTGIDTVLLALLLSGQPIPPPVADTPPPEPPPPPSGDE